MDTCYDGQEQGRHKGWDFLQLQAHMPCSLVRQFALSSCDRLMCVAIRMDLRGLNSAKDKSKFGTFFLDITELRPK